MVVKNMFGDPMYLDKLNTLKLRDRKVYEPYGFNIFEIDRWQKNVHSRMLRKITDIDRFSKRCYEGYYGNCKWMNLFCVRDIDSLPKRILDRIGSEDIDD